MDSYEKNVFINCPFDEAYKPLLHSMIFTILYLGFNPRIALERSNSAETRFSKICELIDSSRLSIHDLSRAQAKTAGEFYRLNMPFELGLDIGARQFNPDIHSTKYCLILEEKYFRHQATISDLSNSDIKAHNNDQTDIIQAVRDWFSENNFCKAPFHSNIWYHYSDCLDDIYNKRKNEGMQRKDLLKLPIPEIIREMREWIANRNN